MRLILRFTFLAALAALVFVAVTRDAITLGPATLYFGEASTPLRLHEAVHRRQWKEHGARFAFRYLSDPRWRVEMEAEAEAARLCLARARRRTRLAAEASLRLHRNYYAEALTSHDRVGRVLAHQGCTRLTRGVREEERRRWSIGRGERRIELEIARAGRTGNG